MPAPIILFVYNRLEHTRRTVEALSENELARESDLWVFSDASKTTASQKTVDEVRSYIFGIVKSDLFNDVKVVLSHQNKGLAKSIIDGVTQVISKYDRAIVMEDDIVTARDFLTFLNEALDFYKNDALIGSITGYSPLKTLPSDYLNDVYLLPRSCSYGWATWKDRWTQVDWEVNDFVKFRQNRIARRLFNSCGSDCYDMLRRQVDGGAESWSIRFGYWQFKAGKLTVYPVVSRVKNIGWDGSGTHWSKVQKISKFNNTLSSHVFPVKLNTLVLDARIIRQAKILYSGSYVTQFARWMRCNGFGKVDRMIRYLLNKLN